MRLKALEVDRFGAWRDLHVSNLSPGFNVIYSPLAEHDSSLIGFIHAVLNGACSTLDKTTSANSGRLRLTIDSSCFQVALGDKSIKPVCARNGNGKTIQPYHSDAITSRLSREIELLLADMEGGGRHLVGIDRRDDRLFMVIQTRRKRIRDLIRKIRQIDAIFQCAPNLQRLLEIDEELADGKTGIVPEQTEILIETRQIDERIADCRIQIKMVRRQRNELRKKIRALSPPLNDEASSTGTPLAQETIAHETQPAVEPSEAPASVSDRQERVNQLRGMLHLEEVLDRARYKREMLENERQQQRDKQVLRPWQVAALGLTLVTGLTLLGFGLLSRPDAIDVPSSLVGLVLMLAAALIKLSYSKSASQRLWSTNQQLNMLVTEIASVEKEHAGLRQRLEVGDLDVAELLDHEVAALSALQERTDEEQTITAVAEDRQQRQERPQLVGQYKRLHDMGQQLIRLVRQLKIERSRYRKIKRQLVVHAVQNQHGLGLESLRHERERIAKCIQSIRRQWGESEIQTFDALADLTDSQLEAERASAVKKLRRHRQRLARASQKRKGGRAGSNLQSGHNGTQHPRRGRHIPILLDGLPMVESTSSLRSIVELLLEQCSQGQQIVLVTTDIQTVAMVRSCGVTVIELPDPSWLATRSPRGQRRVDVETLDVLLHERSTLSLASLDDRTDKGEKAEQVYEVLGPTPLDESVDVLRRIAPDADPRGDSSAQKTISVTSRSDQPPSEASRREVADVSPRTRKETREPTPANPSSSDHVRAKKTSRDVPSDDIMPEWWPD